MTKREFRDSRDEMERILREETVGYLGLCNDGKPYVVPLNYGYVDGRILFHCAMTGRKLDHLRSNPEVCFTVGRQSGEVRRHGEGDPCHVDSESVICHGRARTFDDPQERKRILDLFNRCFRADADEISLETASKCCAVEITIAEMTGRREQDGHRTYWRHRFE
jgi:nitroimidazol reductase NimA-like FMN-containing flavoprotein (pyridoxamine 5'-phosphate oxidase superfamily)